MATGKPIIMGVQGDASNIISDANCGICIKSQDANSLAEAVKKLMLLSKTEIEPLGKNGSSYYHANLSNKIGINSFIKLFKKIIRNKNK